MTTKTKVCLQIVDLMFSCLTPRVKACINLEKLENRTQWSIYRLNKSGASIEPGSKREQVVVDHSALESRPIRARLAAQNDELCKHRRVSERRSNNNVQYVENSVF